MESVGNDLKGKPKKGYLIKQATLVPLFFFVPVLVAGFLVPGYDPIGQHASEITLTGSALARAVVNVGAITTGLSCLALALGILLRSRNHYGSSILVALFGVSMVSNGVYPMGTALHGLYGMGLTLLILPFVACYEWKNEILDKRFFTISLIAGCVIFVYMWSMLVGVDPAAYRGATQRIASVFIFGWIAYWAYVLNRLVPDR